MFDEHNSDLQEVGLLYLKRIVGSSVVQIMTQACYDQCKAFNLPKYFPPLCGLQTKRTNNLMLYFTCFQIE